MLTKSKVWKMNWKGLLLRKVILQKKFEDYPFTTKPTVSTLGSILEISRQERIFIFLPDDSIRNLLRSIASTIYEEYNLSTNPIDILSFDKDFTHAHIARRMIFEGKRSGIKHIFTMDVDPGYKNIEKFSGGVQWYMMESKDFWFQVSLLNFKMKTENSYHWMDNQ